MVRRESTPVEDFDYESLTWEDIHLPERAMSLLNESSGIFRYIVD